MKCCVSSILNWISHLVHILLILVWNCICHIPWRWLFECWIMSEEHSANKMVVEIHMYISQVFVWNVIHIFFLVTLCIFFSYGKDVCNHRHTCAFFRCLGVERSVCMYYSPVVVELKNDNTLWLSIPSAHHAGRWYCSAHTWSPWTLCLTGLTSLACV